MREVIHLSEDTSSIFSAKKDAMILPGATQPCSIAVLLTNVMFYHY